MDPDRPYRTSTIPNMFGRPPHPTSVHAAGQLPQFSRQSAGHSATMTDAGTFHHEPMLSSRPYIPRPYRQGSSEWSVDEAVSRCNQPYPFTTTKERYSPLHDVYDLTPLSVDSDAKHGIVLMAVTQRKEARSLSKSDALKLQTLFSCVFRMQVELMLDPGFDELLDRIDALKQYPCAILYLAGPGKDHQLVLSDYSVLNAKADLMNFFEHKQFKGRPKTAIVHAFESALPYQGRKVQLKSCQANSIDKSLDSCLFSFNERKSIDNGSSKFVEKIIEECIEQQKIDLYKLLVDTISATVQYGTAQLVFKNFGDRSNGCQKRLELQCFEKTQLRSMLEDERSRRPEEIQHFALLVGGKTSLANDDECNAVPEMLSANEEQFHVASLRLCQLNQLNSNKAFFYNGYVYGWTNYESDLANWVRISLKSGGSEQVEVHPEARSAVATCQLKEKSELLCCGGIDQHNNDIKKVRLLRLNPEEEGDEWSKEEYPPLVQARSYHAASYLPYADQVLLTGGLDGETADTCESLDFARRGQGWEKSKNKLNEPRHSHQSIADDYGRVFVFGGTAHDKKAITNTVEVWDPRSSNGWQQAAPMRFERSNFGAVLFNNRIWAIGGLGLGRQNRTGTLVYLESSECLDLRRLDKWIEGPTLSRPRAFSAAVLIPHSALISK